MCIRDSFSGDKLFAGPQAGIIAGRADLVAACGAHPLARALRPGGLVLAALQATTLAYLDRRATTDLPFWTMVAASTDSLRGRAEQLVTRVPGAAIVDTDALPGAGSAPGATIASIGIAIDGDHLAVLRAADPPIIARARDGRTILDLRSVLPADDDHVGRALISVTS